MTAKQNPCLICKSPSTKRGLCDKHYMRYHRAWQSFPLENREAFEARLIAKGLLAAARPGGKLAKDEFAAVATDMLDELERTKLMKNDEESDRIKRLEQKAKDFAEEKLAEQQEADSRKPADENNTNDTSSKKNKRTK